MKQSMRDVITGELSLEYFAKRFGEGWKVASIEWVKGGVEVSPAIETAGLLPAQAALPYGFQITGGGLVQENPLESTVLLLILDQIVKEKRITEIASQLNQLGYSTREGTHWSAADVFNLLPRLIEAGPSLLKSAEWQQRRTAIQESSAERHM